MHIKIQSYMLIITCSKYTWESNSLKSCGLMAWLWLLKHASQYEAIIMAWLGSAYFGPAWLGSQPEAKDVCDLDVAECLTVWLSGWVEPHVIFFLHTCCLQEYQLKCLPSQLLVFSTSCKSISILLPGFLTVIRGLVMYMIMCCSAEYTFRCLR